MTTALTPTIRRVTIVGAGTMGHGIASVSATAGYDVTLTDVNAKMLARALEHVNSALATGVSRGKLTEEQRDDALARITTMRNLPEALAGADLVIEAVPEQLEVKQALFRDIDAFAPSQALLATNTSSLPVAEIAAVVASSDRVVGMHFFNPVPAMRLVELIRALQTSDAALEAARTFAESLGKTAIVVNDSPGFATSRLGIVLGLEAMRMVEQGVASVVDIDAAMELGYNHPVGPLKLTDMVGLDIRLAIANHLHETLKDDTYKPPMILRRMVSEGKLGKKTGHGFYTWAKTT